MSIWRSIRTGYVQIAIILLTTTLLLLLANGIAYLMLDDEQPDPNPLVDCYGDKIYNAYPGWERSAIDSVINQSYVSPRRSTSRSCSSGNPSLPIATTMSNTIHWEIL